MLPLGKNMQIQNKQDQQASATAFDAIVIGAGVGGMYALHHLRDELGLRVRGFDGASDVGGTWWHNRYPGARVGCTEYAVLCLHIFSRVSTRVVMD